MTMIAAWDSRVWTVLRLTIDGRWTWDDHDAVSHDILHMMQWVKTQVDFIIDIRTDYLPNGGIQALDSASVFLRHPQAGFAVLVGTHRYSQHLISLFGDHYPQRALWLLCAPTVQQAHAMLADRQTYQPPAPAYMGNGH